MPRSSIAMAPCASTGGGAEWGSTVGATIPPVYGRCPGSFAEPGDLSVDPVGSTAARPAEAGGGQRGRQRPAGRPLACGAVVKIYTRKGDDGTTGLLYGGRVAKSSPVIEVNGAVDEAQAMLGLARAEAEAGSELDDILLDLERDLWVLMAELATAPENRRKLTAGASLVTPEMVTALEVRIDALNERFEMPTEFVMPGQNRVSAALDVARTVVRRAERGFTAASFTPGLARRALSQPAVGPAVDHGALAGG